MAQVQLSPNPPLSFEPIEPLKISIDNKPNAQIRISKLVAEILELLSNSSVNEKESITKLKEKITRLSEEAAQSKSTLSWISVGSGIVGLAIGTIPLIPLSADPKQSRILSQVAHEMAGALNNTGTKFLSSTQEINEFLKVSQRDLLMREYDHKTTQEQGQSNLKRELQDTAKESLQLAAAASRPT